MINNATINNYYTQDVTVINAIVVKNLSNENVWIMISIK